MKKQLQRLISMVLAFCMVLSVLPGEAAAYFVAGVDHASQDDTGEITVLGEDGSTVTIPVYRLGGTTGRATAYIHYQPAMTQDTADSMTYAYAASGRNDIVIEVEDPQPVAQYQPVGMDRIYAGCELSVEQGVEDGKETDYQLISLTEDVGAEEYIWQQAVVKITEDEEYQIVQSWMSLETESRPELQVDNDIWFSNDVYYDFSCLYTVDGKTYCTATAWEVGRHLCLRKQGAAQMLSANPDLFAPPLLCCRGLFVFLTVSRFRVKDFLNRNCATIRRSRRNSGMCRNSQGCAI